MRQFFGRLRPTSRCGMFVLGSPGLPAKGIRALPAQLARVAVAAGADVRLGAAGAQARTVADGVEVDVAEATPSARGRSWSRSGRAPSSDLLEMPAPGDEGSADVVVRGRRRADGIRSRSLWTGGVAARSSTPS